MAKGTHFLPTLMLDSTEPSIGMSHHSSVSQKFHSISACSDGSLRRNCEVRRAILKNELDEAKAEAANLQKRKKALVTGMPIPTPYFIVIIVVICDGVRSILTPARGAREGGGEHAAPAARARPHRQASRGARAKAGGGVLPLHL